MATKENFQQLITAIDKGDISSVSYLIKQGNGIDINGQNELGEKPLFKAALHGYHDIVKVLLQYGANVNARNGCLGKTALIAASETGHAKICELLLESGADIDMNTEAVDGWTLLVQECSLGYKKMAELYKAIVKMQDNSASSSWTAIVIASKNGNYCVAKLLLDHGPKKKDVKSALIVSCKYGHIRVARLLLEHIVAHSSHGWSALMFASLYNCKEIVQSLLVDKADVNFTDRCGLSPLIVACTNGHYEIAKVLIDHGANINQKKWNGQTSLMSASKGGHTGIVKLLLDHQADIHSQDNNGWTALNIVDSEHHAFDEIYGLLRQENRSPSPDTWGSTLSSQSSYPLRRSTASSQGYHSSSPSTRRSTASNQGCHSSSLGTRRSTTSSQGYNSSSPGTQRSTASSQGCHSSSPSLRRSRLLSQGYRSSSPCTWISTLSSLGYHSSDPTATSELSIDKDNIVNKRGSHTKSKKNHRAVEDHDTTHDHRIILHSATRYNFIEDISCFT